MKVRKHEHYGIVFFLFFLLANSEQFLSAPNMLQ